MARPDRKNDRAFSFSQQHTKDKTDTVSSTQTAFLRRRGKKSVSFLEMWQFPCYNKAVDSSAQGGSFV